MDDLYTTVAWFGVLTNSESMYEYLRVGETWFSGMGRPLKSRVAVRQGKVFRRMKEPTADELEALDDYEKVSYLKDRRGGFYYSDSLMISRQKCIAAVSLPTSVADLGSGELETLLCSVQRCLQPRYGTGFRRALKYGPMSYVIGFGYCPINEVADRLVHNEEKSSWKYANDDRVFERGQLRGVYAWNLLNPSQLQAKIDGMSLRAWIARDPSRGKLASVSKGSDLEVWTVPDRSTRSLIEKDLCKADVVYHTEPCEKRTTLNW